MMRKLLFISSLWVLVSGLVEAEPRKSLIVQAPVIEWHKGHGTDGGDHVHYGMQTSDGGYIMVGQTEKDRNGSDMLVVKTDAKGNLEWQKVKGQNRLNMALLWLKWVLRLALHTVLSLLVH